MNGELSTATDTMMNDYRSQTFPRFEKAVTSLITAQIC